MITLAAVALLLAGCGPEHSVSPATTADPAPTEPDATLREAQDSLKTKTEQLAATAASLQAANVELAEKEQVLGQREHQFKNLSAELEVLKKRDALVFAEVATLQQQGRNSAALDRYKQFLRDYPQSPLAIHAERAIADLTEEVAIEDLERTARLDPTSKARETKRLLDEGLLTTRELAPILKRRTRNQVISLLGKPNRVFPDGTEIGYIDRVTNATGGGKGMLIITFEDSVVSAFRMDYAGPKVIP